MSEYANGFQINIAEVARIKFLDQFQLQLNPIEIITIVMHYDTFKTLHQQLGDVIEQHDAKLANLKKSN